jgi:hypothetical protein
MEAHPIVRAALILLPFGAVYLGLTLAFGVEEARRSLARVRGNATQQNRE